MMTTREIILLGLVDAVRDAYQDGYRVQRLEMALRPLLNYAEHLRRDEQVPDPMPPGWNRPAPATRDELVGVVTDALRLVNLGDSWEGFIQWSMPTDEPELEGAEYGLMARYRIGNLGGQGGLRVWSPEPGDEG